MKTIKRKRRTFSDEFKGDAVPLCRASGSTISGVSRDLDVSEPVLRDWLKRASVVAAPGGPTLTVAERDELTELRRRVKRLEMEREILKKAAAFFVKGSA